MSLQDFPVSIPSVENLNSGPHTCATLSHPSSVTATRVLGLQVHTTTPGWCICFFIHTHIPVFLSSGRVPLWASLPAITGMSKGVKLLGESHRCIAVPTDMIKEVAFRSSPSYLPTLRHVSLIEVSQRHCDIVNLEGSSRVLLALPSRSPGRQGLTKVKAEPVKCRRNSCFLDALSALLNPY